MGSIKRDSMLITLLSYAGAAIGYVNKIVLFPNFLSEEQVGLTNILLSFGLMYAQFAAMGFNVSLLRFFPFFKTDDHKHKGLFFWSALAISSGFVLFTALYLIFRETFIDYFIQKSPLISKYYLLLIPMGLTLLFYNFYNTWLQSLGRSVISSFMYEVVLRLLMTLEISLYAFGLIDFEQFIIGYVLIFFVPTLVLLIYTAAIDESYCKVEITPTSRKLLKIAGVYGLWQFMKGASFYLIPVIDQSMLSAINGLAQTGVYTVMMYMANAMIIPYMAMTKVSTPLVAQFWKERDMFKMQKIYRNFSLVNLIIGCLFFVVIWINLDNIFSILPESYAAGRYVFLFLGLSRVIDMYTGLNSIILGTSKKYRQDLIFSLIVVALTVATNAYAIPRYGMTGAAFATMFTIIVYNAIRLAFVWKHFKMLPFAMKDLTVVALSVGCLLVSGVIPQLGNFIIDACLRTALIGGLFAGTIYMLKISVDINQMIDSSVKKIFKTF